MRSSETSGTPATTRKRGRNQTSAAGSLSLLAVPKLKISDQTPPHLPAVELSGRAPPKEGIKQPPGRQTLLSKSPKQQIKPVAAAIPGGKENRPVRLNQPAQAGTVKPPVRQATVRASRTPQKDSATHAALPAPCTSDRQSVGLQHSTKIQGLSATASISGTAVDTQSARPDLILAKHDQGTCASSVCREADQALMAQGLPLACHTAINKRRRPVGQATRYGEWYTGNDTDLDEQLLEYNAEQARAASEAGIQLERRKSDLASYTADKDDADFTDEENAEAAHKSSSRLRRSTIAPGQDTAAQVAAMTAELNRLADDMLPKEDERKGKDGRKPKQHSQQHKDLRQRLVESWDGKTYYERLQAEAEHQPNSQHGNVGNRAVQQCKEPEQARPGASTPAADKGKPLRAVPPVVFSPELLGSSEGRHRGSIHEPPRAQTESSRPLTGRADSSQHKGQEAAAPAGQPARQAAARKRLPPLPLSARGPPQGSKPTAATRHAAQQASSTARQQPHKSSQSEQMAASHRCTAADTKVQADQAAVPGTSGCQQELQKLNAASESEQGFAGGASPPVDAIQTQQQTQQQAEQQAQRQAQRQPKQQPQQQPQRKAAPSKGRQASSASVSLPECSALSIVTSSNTAESGKASARSAAKPVGAAGHQQAGAGERAGQGQQQVARLAASNTALLSELVELQAAKALMEEQLLHEQKARLAAEASNKTLTQQLAEQRSALVAVHQQVRDLQSAVPSVPGKAKHAGSPGGLHSSAATATLQESLRVVKHHAAALARAAAALENVKLN